MAPDKRTIHVDQLRDAVRQLALDAEFALDERTHAAIERSILGEKSPLGRQILGEIVENAGVAGSDRRPLCQDTGMAILWVEVGQDVCFDGGTVQGAVDEGIRQAWGEGALRNSIVADPLRRENTGDNTPAVLHLEEMSGSTVRIHFLAKGGGSENQSFFTVLKPTQGRAGVVEFVADGVIERAAYACPPVVVGVGLGGSADKAAWLAKKALFRPLGEATDDPETTELERELLSEINAGGVGPMGLGGSTTAIACHVERAPCHIASLPVAVCLNCHSHRTGSVEL